VRLAAVQTAALARRAFVNTLRTPQALFPSLFFPLVLMAIFTGSFGAAPGRLPGFPPVRGFLDFAVAGAILQGILIGGTTAGAAFALDIEGGFFDRLVASPIPRVSIPLGRILAGSVIAAMQVAYFLILGLVFGAHIAAGVPGVLLVLVIGVATGTGFCALGVMIALRARSASTVQGIFPLVFVVLFISSAFFPRKLLSHPADWVAAYNPLSYVADGIRDPIISSITASTVLEGLAAALGIAAAGTALSVVALRGRLREA
jgi:ABC-2 type transport system permease protein